MSPLEIVDGAIDRIEALNPRLNAVIHPLFDKARAAAASRLPSGPFTGVPILLKDFGARSAGDPYHEGTRFLKQAGWKAAADDHVVSLLRGAGFVIVGRTNVPELASTATTEPDAYGATRNPWDNARSPGGSSGGSAASVASGMVAVAHGNDGGGSIRIPASECGLVGLKPSRGRTSWGPTLGESMSGLAVNFALTRSVRDAAALLDILAVGAVGDPYHAARPTSPYAEASTPGRLRVGLCLDAKAMTGGIEVVVHPDCVEAAELAARVLENLGHAVETAQPEALGDEEIAFAMGTITFATVARGLEYWSQEMGRAIGQDEVNADNWAMAEAGRATSVTAYLAALDRIHSFRVDMAQWWQSGFDLLVSPTLAEPPPRLGELATDPAAPLAASIRAIPFATFTTAFNLTGQPAISLPLHWTADGLPIGVQLAAAYGREDLLLAVARQLEEALPWSDRRPPDGPE